MTEPGETASDGEKIKVLVADDQQIVRKGLVLLIGMLDGIEVVGAARDGAEAVLLAGQQAPDVVLMDLNMPVLNGVAATATLREQVPGCKVLVLTTYADDDSVFPALQAGARGYLTKDADDDAIEDAIRSVHEGRIWLDPEVQARLVTAVQTSEVAPPAAQRQQAHTPQTPAPSDVLTPRETQVLILIARGLSNAEICARLVVSPATVKTHINRIFTKIGAADRAQAVGYAYRNNLVEPWD
ncbi:response regulator transcription factor [Streptomyces sp. NPDC048277]|uniref:response regulator transcription factor n=1 Tax=unclassified Streptomyces TaxID=2593676 RepID=UPI003405727C